MLNVSKTPISLWIPRTVGIMTIFLLPGGWFLGVLNFYRLGHKRDVIGHLIFFLCFTLVLGAVAAFNVNLPSATAFLLGVGFGGYMYNANTTVIDEYRADGGIVEYASGLSGFFIVIGATLGWFVLFMLMMASFILYQTYFG